MLQMDPARSKRRWDTWCSTSDPSPPNRSGNPQLGQVFVHMSYITIHVCICDTFNNPTFWWHKSIVYANLISIFRVSIIKKKIVFFFIKQQANNDHGHKKSADKICNKHLAVVRMARWNSFSFSRLPNGTLFFTPSTARINLRYD